MATQPKVKTCLWFNNQGEEAAKYYVSLIEGSRIDGIFRYGKDAPMPEGTALVVDFTLGGTPYMALNGGTTYTLDEACSLMVSCDTQAEIDRLWNALIEGGGKEVQCGWLKDRFGVSWQIVPSQLGKWLTSSDKAASARVFNAVMGMVKLDIAKMEAAYKGA